MTIMSDVWAEKRPNLLLLWSKSRFGQRAILFFYVRFSILLDDMARVKFEQPVMLTYKNIQIICQLTNDVNEEQILN